MLRKLRHRFIRTWTQETKSCCLPVGHSLVLLTRTRSHRTGIAGDGDHKQKNAEFHPRLTGVFRIPWIPKPALRLGRARSESDGPHAHAREWLFFLLRLLIFSFFFFRSRDERQRIQVAGKLAEVHVGLLGRCRALVCHFRLQVLSVLHRLIVLALQVRHLHLDLLELALRLQHLDLRVLRETLSPEMRYNFADGADHVFHIGIAHTVKHGQADQALISVLRHRILPAPVAKAIAVIGMKMYRDVMHVYSNVFLTKRSKDLAAIRREFCQVETNWVQVPRRIGLCTNRGRNYSPDLAKSRGVADCDFSAPRQIRFQLAELLDAQSTCDV